MRTPNIRRPRAAIAIACVALFAALGGGAYAVTKIGTEDLKSEAVTGPKIAKQAIKGNRIAADTIKGKKIQEDTLGTVPNADAVNDKSAVCDEGTREFLGQCWETAARAAALWLDAASTCTQAGGYLPPVDQLRGASQNGFALAATDEWTSDITEVPSANTPHVVTVSAAGGVNFTNGAADPKGFRCVYPLLHS